MTLGERLRAIHAALDRAGIEHAFGGAIALAYWTLEPRGTRDLDVNVFAPVERADEVLAGLPPGVAVTDTDRATLARDGQVRLWFDDTPVDLFFDYAPIHAAAARHLALVPFEGEQIPILGPVELGAFKAVFDRTKDWADIEAMLAAGALGADELRLALAAIVGDDDERLARVTRAARLAAEG